MSFAVAHSKIEDRWRRLIADPEDLATAYPNAKFAKPTGKAWAALTIHQDDSRLAALGGPSRRFRHSGTLIVQLFMVLNTGTSDARKLIDKIDQAFSGKSEGIVTFRTALPQDVGRAGDWHQINLNVPFYFDRT